MQRVTAPGPHRLRQFYRIWARACPIGKTTLPVIMLTKHFKTWRDIIIISIQMFAIICIGNCAQGDRKVRRRFTS